jgi:branched-subunit amino acid aminotransferase/4-amino-4-deoxychorismate lyase
MGSYAAYLNGQWISSSDLRIPVDDLGFALGTTVTERLRTFRGAVFRLDAHLSRLRGSLGIVGLDADTISAEIGRAIGEFVKRNAGRIAPNDDWAIAAFATPGRAGRGTPTVCVHGNPLPFHSWADQFETGVPTVVSSFRQVPNNCWPTDLKCRSRMHYYLAYQEAAAKRPGARAIVLDQDGFVAEGTTANLVMYRNGEGIISPPENNILIGVSLGVLRELAAVLNIPFVTRPFTTAELVEAEEAMFASTSICLLPIIECDGKKLGDGRPGPVYRRLLSVWSELVGVDIVAQVKQFANRTT